MTSQDRAPTSSATDGDALARDGLAEARTVGHPLPDDQGESHDATVSREPAQMAAGRSRRRDLLDRLLTSVIVAAAVVAVGLGVLSYTANLHYQTVTSGSMRPAISPGDVAVTQSVAPNSLRLGDVIAFFPPGGTEAVLHRIVSLDKGAIKTRGDANSVEDSWQVTISGPTAYRLVAVVPYLGWLTQLQRPILILAGLLLALAVVLELVKELRGRYGRQARS